MSKVRQVQAEREIARQLKRAGTPEEVDKVLDNVLTKTEAIKENYVRERVPGLIKEGKKTPWTKRDVENAFPLVTFVPQENCPVCFNGVNFYLRAGVEVNVPRVFVDIYNQHLKALREQHKDLAGLGINVEAGAGALEI